MKKHKKKDFGHAGRRPKYIYLIPTRTKATITEILLMTMTLILVLSVSMKIERFQKAGARNRLCFFFSWL